MAHTEDLLRSSLDELHTLQAERHKEEEAARSLARVERERATQEALRKQQAEREAEAQAELEKEQAAREVVERMEREARIAKRLQQVNTSIAEQEQQTLARLAAEAHAISRRPLKWRAAVGVTVGVLVLSIGLVSATHKTQQAQHKEAIDALMLRLDAERAHERRETDRLVRELTAKKQAIQSVTQQIESSTRALNEKTARERQLAEKEQGQRRLSTAIAACKKAAEEDRRRIFQACQSSGDPLCGATQPIRRCDAASVR